MLLSCDWQGLPFPSLIYNEMCLGRELTQLWMAVQLSVKTESFLNVTAVAAVDLMQFTLTEVGESKPRMTTGLTTNWGEASDMLKGMATRGISTSRIWYKLQDVQLRQRQTPSPGPGIEEYGLRSNFIKKEPVCPGEKVERESATCVWWRQTTDGLC